MTEQPEDAYPVAYCAPGNRAGAERVLAARGQHVARIVEEPRLEGTEDPYVAAAERIDLMKLSPVRYEFPAPEFQSLLRFREDLLFGARVAACVNTPWPVRLSSVI
jgi:hypothetical protein